MFTGSCIVPHEAKVCLFLCLCCCASEAVVCCDQLVRNTTITILHYTGLFFDLPWRQKHPCFAVIPWVKAVKKCWKREQMLQIIWLYAGCVRFFCWERNKGLKSMLEVGSLVQPNIHQKSYYWEGCKSLRWPKTAVRARKPFLFSLWPAFKGQYMTFLLSRFFHKACMFVYTTLKHLNWPFMKVPLKGRPQNPVHANCPTLSHSSNKLNT